jgi:hypothetical protein
VRSHIPEVFRDGFQTELKINLTTFPKPNCMAFSRDKIIMIKKQIKFKGLFTVTGLRNLSIFGNIKLLP